MFQRCDPDPSCAQRSGDALTAPASLDLQVSKLPDGRLQFAGLPLSTLSELPLGTGSKEFRGYLVERTNGWLERNKLSLLDYVVNDLEKYPSEEGPLRYCAYHRIAFPDQSILIGIAVRIRDGLTISGREQSIDRVDRTFEPGDYQGYQFQYIGPSGKIFGGLPLKELKRSIMVECGDHEWAGNILAAMAAKFRDGSGVDAAYEVLRSDAKARGFLTTGEY